MNRDSYLNLVQLDLDRLPGFSLPFVVPAQPGINLICGANEAGKTSVARAIAQLLWPDQKVNKPFEVRAVFADSRGVIQAQRQDNDPVQWLRDGISAPAPDLPGDHLAACYRLGLLDLNRAGANELDGNLATEIRQQMAGGFDLATVAQLFPAPKNRRANERSKWDTAKSDLRRCESRHRELSEQERGLASLLAQQDEAQQSSARAEQLVAATAHLKLSQRQDELITSLASLPSGMKLVREGDDETWQELANQIRSKSEHAADLLHQIELRADRLTALNAQADLSELAVLVQKVSELAKENEALGLALADVSARHDEALLELAPELLAAKIPLAAEGSFQKLAEVHSDLLEQRARQDHWQHVADLPLWREKANQSRSPAPWLPLAAGALETVAALLLLLGSGRELNSPLAQGLLLLLAADGVFRMSRWRRSDSTAVADQIKEEVVHQQRQADAAVAEAENARRTLLADLGQSEHRHDLGLLQELDRVARARSAAEALAGAQGRHQHSSSTLSDAVATAILALESAGARNVATTPAGVKSALVQMTQQKAKAEGLLEAQANDKSALVQAERELAHAQERQNEMHQRLNFSAAEADYETALHERIQALPQYETWHLDLDGVRREMRSLSEKLEPTDANLTAEELATQTENARRRAANHTELTAEIAALRERINFARHGDELAKARAHEAETAADLHDLLESQRDHALGRLFLETTVQRYENDTLPPLLAAMNEFLNTFTQGLYELRVIPTGFVAIDNQGRQRALRDLSDGTRAQLLLAARLGFIQQAERGVQAPLFLDEAFTASDPERFHAIAGAMGQLAAKTGRQIFYLTSNPSDVQAWQRALKSHDFPEANVIDLGLQKGQAASVARGALTPLATTLIPAPGADSSEAYAAKLNLPPLDPWANENALPIFYLIADDLSLVHRLLVGGTPTLGQWRQQGALLERAGEVSAAEADRLRARGKIWSTVLKVWAIGRGAPITRQTLSDSQALSESMMSPALDLLASTSGDAEAFMAGVNHGQIKRLNVTKKQALQEYLERKGHWDHRDVWSADQIVTHVIGAVANELQTGLLTAPQVRELVLSLHSQACAITATADGSHQTG